MPMLISYGHADVQLAFAVTVCPPITSSTRIAQYLILYTKPLNVTTRYFANCYLRKNSIS